MKITCLSALSLTAFAAPALANVETGDVKQGFPVISRLNTTALEDGSHRFWFRAGENACK